MLERREEKRNGGVGASSKRHELGFVVCVIIGRRRLHPIENRKQIQVTPHPWLTSHWKREVKDNQAAPKLSLLSSLLPSTHCRFFFFFLLGFKTKELIPTESRVA